MGQEQSSLVSVGRLFGESFHQGRLELRKVGVELEFPVVYDCGKDLFNFQKALTVFVRNGWEKIVDELNPEVIIGVRKKGVCVTVGVGASIAEISIPPQKDLHSLCRIYSNALDEVQETISCIGGEMLGLGVNPFCRQINWAKKTRYECLAQGVSPGSMYLTLGAASHVHIDVSLQEAVYALNAMNALSGVIIALCANSPVFNNQETGKMAFREHWWDNLSSRAGITPSKFNTTSEYLQYVVGLPCILARQNGRYFNPNMSFGDFAKSNGKFDLKNQFSCHESTLWHDACLRTDYGTVEIRSACAQPHSDYFVVAAFCLGLVEQLFPLWTVIREVNWGSWVNLRKEAISKGMGIVRENQETRELVGTFLDLARKGLESRGRKEEVFLDPLMERFRRQASPAEDCLAVFKREGVDGLISFAL